MKKRTYRCSNIVFKMNLSWKYVGSRFGKDLEEKKCNLSSYLTNFHSWETIKIPSGYIASLPKSIFKSLTREEKSCVEKILQDNVKCELKIACKRVFICYQHSSIDTPKCFSLNRDLIGFDFMIWQLFPPTKMNEFCCCDVQNWFDWK